MYYMQINKNFMHQAGDEPRLYYEARSTNHQDFIFILETCSKKLRCIANSCIVECTGMCLVSRKRKSN